MRAKAGVLLKGPIGVQKLQLENCNFDGNDRPLSSIEDPRPEDRVAETAEEDTSGECDVGQDAGAGRW